MKVSTDVSVATIENMATCTRAPSRLIKSNLRVLFFEFSIAPYNINPTKNENYYIIN